MRTAVRAPLLPWRSNYKYVDSLMLIVLHFSNILIHIQIIMTWISGDRHANFLYSDFSSALNSVCKNFVSCI